MQNYGLKDEGEISNYIRQKSTFKFMEVENLWKELGWNILRRLFWRQPST